MKDNLAIVTEVEVHVVTQGEQGPPGAQGLPGASGASTTEVVSVWNNGDPQIVFTKTGDTVMNNAA